MVDLLQALWREPRVPDAPAPRWQDWLLVLVVVALAGIEVALREEVVWRPLSLVVVTALALTLPWRRAQPALVVIIAFGTHTVLQVIARAQGVEWEGLYTGVFLLVLPYALLRWGSGRQACIGLGFIGLTVVVNIVSGRPPLGEIIGGSLFVLFPSALGATMRYQDAAQRRARQQVRLREREQLARELHDTVAHHVSAIAIQAQAGRTRAAMRPQAPLEALQVIEEAASKTLSEMRAIVRTMRGDGQVDYTPAASVADIERLARDNSGPLHIDVELTGDLDELDTTLAATLYRVSQESITNAVRHADGARNVSIYIHGDQEHIELKVRDDGNPLARKAPAGLGLRGMAERVALLGGTFEAGPAVPRGWTVEATLPRQGASS